MPLASILSNNRVTFAALQLVAYQLHFHGVKWLNFTKRVCDENVFLAFCISRGNGCFAYRLSQAGKRDDS